MRYSNFTSAIQQFKVYEAFTQLQGEFNFLKPQFFFQPYADLEVYNEGQDGTLKNNALIGLRLITNFYDNERLCIEFVSESRCLLDYSEPLNEEDIFQEIIQKAIEQHSKLFGDELKEIGFLHSTFSSVNEQEKRKIFETLIEHFREQF